MSSGPTAWVTDGAHAFSHRHTPTFETSRSREMVATAGAPDVHVPVVSSLDDVYGSPTEETRERYRVLANGFERAYGRAPSGFARAPGRVNLIGEHIDYEGYSVLPMAIGLDAVVAYGVNETSGKIRVGNANPEYTEKTFGTSPDQDVDTSSLHWTNYVMCGYKGVFDFLEESGGKSVEPVGLDLMIDGTVPTGSGLSSSSALCCASALAVMSAHGLSFTKGEIADFTCKCERYSGTQSGGMDQAISIMGEAGVAKLVDFNPIQTNDVYLPENCAFVIGNCLAVSNKAETAHERYNLRVVECRLAAMVLGRKLGMSDEEVVETQTLQDIEKRVGNMSSAKAAAEEYLHDGYYDAREIEEIIGVDAFLDVFSSPASKAVLNHNVTGYKLLSRTLHVYSEAGRVHLFAAACAMKVDPAELGVYMNGSHESCRALYECSCPELDELVDAFRAAGALGARLTGAGWGGCAVALVSMDKVQDVLSQVGKTYYASRIANGVITEDDMSAVLFATLPSNGAVVLKTSSFD